ncbi:hypothetical protein IE53DRAFT_107435 [Violaceomyces palustris]|uniref:Uncharacterized protein n=1 Tax=Violaceomyces palustris TaxID=1673888 RepID=A0ACD0NWM6_9BASI|nr:hypothetical protein IE53DRAFT_107435 [Violaceomyces palustris]
MLTEMHRRSICCFSVIIFTSWISCRAKEWGRSSYRNKAMTMRRYVSFTGGKWFTRGEHRVTRRKERIRVVLASHHRLSDVTRDCWVW